MELDGKIRYATLGVTAAAIVVTALGLHFGVHGMHLRVLEGGPGAD